ncbi:MerR family transcriptional regulator [Candidatus Solincola tengchongensis]|uniref:transcriptional regulator FtsR n=1 Tax=Candidatus Solincola tengchongensis TaxID=2900693 RepID=UPI00257BD1AE|nr:MerR family transcriptional regulator [Candidatus Solincola tengchongensis]
MGQVKEKMSIGELLKLLQQEFPELTISKIRFLESEGLLSPERTPSGYRKFSQADAQRLRFILKLQKEKYLPLKVIREKLNELESGRMRAGDLAAAGESEAFRVGEEISAYQEATLPRENLPQALDIDLSFADTLEEYGLICSHQGEDGLYYEREDVKILRIAREFSRYGLEPRHMRMYENLTDREVMAFEQIIMPSLKSKDPEARKRALDVLLQLVNLSRELKDQLLKNRVKEYFRQNNQPVPF